MTVSCEYSLGSVTDRDQNVETLGHRAQIPPIPNRLVHGVGPTGLVRNITGSWCICHRLDFLVGVGGDHLFRVFFLDLPTVTSVATSPVPSRTT